MAFPLQGSGFCTHAIAGTESLVKMVTALLKSTIKVLQKRKNA
jgi:hypothetical protein